MRLLLCLAQRAGETVSIDELLNQVWAGVVVTPDSVYQAVALLRRLLGDDAKQPKYIATVPRLGYRMVADVGPWTGDPASLAVSAPQPHNRVAWGAVAAVGAAVVLALGVTLLAVLPNHGTLANTGQVAPVARSIAVLPFLDLTTQEMNEEYFADGMTEELIGKLSKVPGLRVPGPTASFYYKGKQVKVADIAKSLGVVYLLDGSLRKSGATLRVAARLVRADDGYVIWSGTYDRPLDDKLHVQDDIASEITQALLASIP